MYQAHISDTISSSNQKKWQGTLAQITPADRSQVAKGDIAQSMLEDGLTFRGRLAPQEGGVSVNVFFYVKKEGSRGEKEPRAGQNAESKWVRPGWEHREWSVPSSGKVNPHVPWSSARSCTRFPTSLHTRYFREPWLLHGSLTKQ